MIEQALEFLKIGRANNEDVMFVTDAMPINSIREKIAKGWKDVNLDKMEQEGRITLSTFREWIMPDGKVDLQNAITDLSKKAQQSKEEHGRKGLRVVGDTNPFFDSGMTEELINYEKLFHKKHGFSLNGLCAYIKDRFHSLEKSDVQFLYEYHNTVIGAAITKT
jgi:hypothetical protein